MKLLLTGVSGLLGINFAQEMMNEHQVIGVDRGKLVNAPFKVLKYDLLEKDSVESILDAAQADWVVNCAALADLDVCEEEPDLAKQLNTDLPRRFARACKIRNIPFAHISTDAVFDGQKDGYYSEEDPPSPVGVYSKTKLDGEWAALTENPKAIVARVNFYGWSLNGRRSLAEFFFNNLSNNKSMSGFTDVIFCPMLVNDTARTLVEMLKRELKGLYHLVGPQAMSKYQFGVELARRFHMRESDITPKSVNFSGLIAKRSNNLWLSTRKLSTDLGEDLPDFSTGLEEFYAQHEQGYPQKIRSYQQP
ncbi:MAG: SDR family oxidoreductase [Anaerolineales bacterium]|nr:SDR family oxidoreductase [Anaerolineales bacterium]GJQ35267.1 MAG: NAD(P)-dependent oxidoreductase [Anaerolineaceae bacterium]